MDYTDKTCKEFVACVGTGEPVPGGGSAAALAGALGASLGAMVASLTIGKIKDSEEREVLQQQIDEILGIQRELVELVQKDIDGFEPLAKLYRRKAAGPEEKRKLDEEKQKALYEACLVPMEIVRKCGRAIELAEEFVSKGSRIVIADAASSAVLLKAAMQGASFNIYVNASMLKDKDLAKRINGECTSRIVYYGALAEAVFGKTTNTLIDTVVETDTIF